MAYSSSLRVSLSAGLCARTRQALPTVSATTNQSYRVDETYLKICGQYKDLYRAVASTGQTIDFLLTAHRETAAAKRFFRKAFPAPGNPSPRVIKVDKNAA